VSLLSVRKKEREGTQSHKTLYFSYLSADTPWTDSHKIRRARCTSQLSQNVVFVIKFSGVSDLQGVKIPNFHIDFAGHYDNSATLPLQPVM